MPAIKSNKWYYDVFIIYHFLYSWLGVQDVKDCTRLLTIESLGNGGVAGIIAEGILCWHT